MIEQLAPPLADLYEQDETAWLDAMARLVAERRWEEVDAENLSEFLTDMARRDRREAKSRLTILLAHLLKWQYQPAKRTGSWKATILVQHREVTADAESGVIRNHIEEVLAAAYADAKKEAAAETGLRITELPTDSPYSLDQLLSDDFFTE